MLLWELPDDGTPQLTVLAVRVQVLRVLLTWLLPWPLEWLWWPLASWWLLPTTLSQLKHQQWTPTLTSWTRSPALLRPLTPFLRVQVLLVLQSREPQLWPVDPTRLQRWLPHLHCWLEAEAVLLAHLLVVLRLLLLLLAPGWPPVPLVHPVLPLTVPIVLDWPLLVRLALLATWTEL